MRRLKIAALVVLIAAAGVLRPLQAPQAGVNYIEIYCNALGPVNNPPIGRAARGYESGADDQNDPHGHNRGNDGSGGVFGSVAGIGRAVIG